MRKNGALFMTYILDIVAMAGIIARAVDMILNFFRKKTGCCAQIIPCEKVE
jgi:hypothetical protein